MSAESAAGDFRPIDQGAIAQLGERLLCKQEVAGSIPAGSTSSARQQRAMTRAHGTLSPQGAVPACAGVITRQRVISGDAGKRIVCSLTIRKVFVLTLSFQAKV